MKQMKNLEWYVNVNKHVIAKNIKTPAGERKPAVRVSRGKSGTPRYGNEFKLPEGSYIKYDADKPILKCGARLVIVCPTEPELIR